MIRAAKSNTIKIKLRWYLSLLLSPFVLVACDSDAGVATATDPKGMPYFLSYDLLRVSSILNQLELKSLSIPSYTASPVVRFGYVAAWDNCVIAEIESDDLSVFTFTIDESDKVQTLNLTSGIRINPGVLSAFNDENFWRPHSNLEKRYLNDVSGGAIWFFERKYGHSHDSIYMISPDLSVHEQLGEMRDQTLYLEAGSKIMEVIGFERGEP